MTIYTALVTQEGNVVGLTMAKSLDKLNFSIYRKHNSTAPLSTKVLAINMNIKWKM
jgi:hypothetical protein